MSLLFLFGYITHSNLEVLISFQADLTTSLECPPGCSDIRYCIKHHERKDITPPLVYCSGNPNPISSLKVLNLVRFDFDFNWLGHTVWIWLHLFSDYKKPVIEIRPDPISPTTVVLGIGIALVLVILIAVFVRYYVIKEANKGRMSREYIY